MNVLVDGFYFPSHIDPNWLILIKREIWKDHEYDRYGLNIKEGDIVLDFGANVGTFTKYALNKGAKRVYSFECDNNYFECLNLNLNQSPNVMLMKGFVSDRSEEGHFNFVKIFSLFNLTEVDFCKIDIENWEYPLLINSNPIYLKKIKQFAIEVHEINIFPEKVLQLIEIFSKAGFYVNYERIHQDSTLGMLYCKRKDI